MGVDVMESVSPSPRRRFESVQTIARQVDQPRMALARRVGKISTRRPNPAVAEAFRIHTFIATSPMHIATKLRSTLDEVINALSIW
ncbi:hypothetical protein ACNKHX_00470 [Shigella flexneri]